MESLGIALVLSLAVENPHVAELILDVVTSIFLWQLD